MTGMAADIPAVTPPVGGWRDRAAGGTPVTAEELNERDDALLAVIEALNTGVVPDALAARIATGGDAPTSFTHVQNDAQDTWTIHHPLLYRPAVAVLYAGEDTARLVPIEYPATGTVIIHNGAPARGIALLS